MKIKYFALVAACLLSVKTLAQETAISMHQLEGDRLSQIMGQKINLDLDILIPDRFKVHRYAIQEMIQSLIEPNKQLPLKNEFNQIFRIMENGQVKIQIDRDVVSIGTIEFRLSFEGLNDLGNNLVDQIQF